WSLPFKLPESPSICNRSIFKVGFTPRLAAIAADFHFTDPPSPGPSRAIDQIFPIGTNNFIIFRMRDLCFHLHLGQRNKGRPAVAPLPKGVVYRLVVTIE